MTEEGKKPASEVEVEEVKEEVVVLPEEIELAIASDSFDYDSLSEVDPKLHNQISQKLIEARKGFAVAGNIEKFQELDQVTAQKLIEIWEGPVVAENLERFQGLDYNQIAQMLLDAGNSFAVVNNIEKFKGLNKKIGNLLIKGLLEYGSMQSAFEVNEHSGNIDKILTRSYQDFGDRLTLGIYKTYKDLDEGIVSDEVKALGVKHLGETGMNELKNKLRGIQSELISGELDPQIALDSEIAMSYLMSAIRFESSAWGDTDEESFKKTVEYYLRTKDKIRELPEEYEPSAVVNIAKIDQEKVGSFELSEQFLSRYGKLMRSIKEARELLDNPEAISELQDITQQKREVVIGNLELKLKGTQHEKAKENIQRKIEELKSLDLDQLAEPQETFKVLNSFKGEFDEELREFMFYWAFQSHPNLQNENLSEFDPSSPTQEQLSWALNFIDHITNQETFAKYFTDKKARKAFNGMLNTAALQQELSRWQNQEIKGTMKMKLVPSRDLLTEFSGHIGDACWASKKGKDVITSGSRENEKLVSEQRLEGVQKDGTILDVMPNITSLAMIQNPDDPKHERIAGASLLIEAQGKDDEPLLIIRGLNPIQNVINQLSYEDFYNKLVEYLKPISDKMGRKLAIVIDNPHAASTNRDGFFDHLDKVRETAQKVELKSNDDTMFNGYDIRNVTYLVE